MLRTKTADRIVCIAVVFMLAAAVCLWAVVKPVQGNGSHGIGYESQLFDQSRVHTIEITADGWDDIIINAAAKKYRECAITIDGEDIGQAGIRVKGDASISSVAALGSTRYSFKVEFNHYVKGRKYHGLDKLNLNNMFRDATMMKDYLAYTLMSRMGVPSPLCSYVRIIVNGEPWGLYLAVEDVDDAFRDRNGMVKGELYKPESAVPGTSGSDMNLVYTDDDPGSYSNIFDNAKTKIKTKDKIRLISSLKKLKTGEDTDRVVNRDEVAAWLAVHNFVCNEDSYTGRTAKNYFLHERKGRLTIVPWDYNQGFGDYSATRNATFTVNAPVDDPVSGGTTDSRPLISWIFKDEESLAVYHETYSRFLRTCIENGWMEEEITRVQDMIRPHAENNPSAFFTMETHEKAVSTLKAFCTKRAESVRGQLEGTIPSTKQGQLENKSTLIDAGEIVIADMSKMDNRNNPGSGERTIPSMQDFKDESTAPVSGHEDAVLTTSAENTKETAETEVPAEQEQPTETKNKTDRDSILSGPGLLIRNSLSIFLLLAAILIIRRLRGHNE